MQRTRRGRAGVRLLGTGLLAAFMLQVWLGHGRISWQSEPGQLLLEGCWLFGTWRKTIRQAEVAVVRIRLGQLLASRFWDVDIRHTSGNVTWLTRTYIEVDAQAVGSRISAAIDRPLEAV